MLTNDQAINVAKTVQSWIDYQVGCGRKTLLSEAYLGHPIVDALAAQSRTSHIVCEYDHPNFVNAGRGRNRQLDYVLLSRDRRRPVTALEVKWCRDGNADHQRVLNDVLRLECVRNEEQQGMSRYFLLAGLANHVDTFLRRRVRMNGTLQPFVDHILPRQTQEATIDLHSSSPEVGAYLKTFETDYRIAVPRAYRVRFLAECAGHQSKVFLWQVSSLPHRTVFTPATQWPQIPAAQ